MKRSLIFLVTLCLLVGGCHRNSQTGGQLSGEPVQLRDVELTFDSIAYHDHPDAVPSISVDAVLVLPNDNPANPVSAVLRRNMLADAVGGRCASAGDATEALLAYVSSLQSEFDEAMADMEYDSYDDDGLDYMFKWESELRTSVEYYSDPLLVYKTTTYSYAGGAHGYGADSYSVYSTLNGKRQQLDDVFRDDPLSRQTLAELVKAELKRMIATRQEYQGMEVFEWNDVTPVDNFYVSEQGVTFSFPQYEIAAYCFGQIEISLPAADIRPYLVEGSPVALFFDRLASGDELAVK